MKDSQTNHTHDIPVEIRALLERLERCDGKQFDATVVTWEQCQLLVGEVARLQRSVGERGSTLNISYTAVQSGDDTRCIGYRIEDLGKLQPCCSDMGEAVNDGKIEFCPEGHFIMLPACYIYSAEPGWGQDDLEKDYSVISFCPFCGSKIVCTETKRVKQVVEVVQQTVATRVVKEEPLG